MKILLASKSPRRRKMLKELGIKYTLWNGEADETVTKEYKPHSLVKLLAKRKAMAAYKDVKRNDKNTPVGVFFCYWKFGITSVHFG